MTIDTVLLRKVLRACPNEGRMFWRRRSPDMFVDRKLTASHICAVWNSRYADTEAFTCTQGDGYKSGHLFGKTYLAHRVIWALYHGKWPEAQIDHVDGCRTNNRISNLRSVCITGNARNRRLPSNNTSGVSGVTWDRAKGRWSVTIGSGKKNIWIGGFEDLDSAAAARKAAEARFGYHPNHGRH